MPMSTTRTRPACERPGSNTSPGLRAAKVTVLDRRCTAVPCTAPVRPSTPDGMSTATTGPPHAPSVVGEPRGVAFEGAVEPGAVHRVDREVGRRARARQLTPVDDPTRARPRATRTPQRSSTRGGHQAVATVVALPAHDHRAVSVATPERPACLPGDRASGAFHEDVDRRAGGDRALVGVAPSLRA